MCLQPREGRVHRERHRPPCRDVERRIAGLGGAGEVASGSKAQGPDRRLAERLAAGRYLRQPDQSPGLREGIGLGCPRYEDGDGDAGAVGVGSPREARSVGITNTETARAKTTIALNAAATRERRDPGSFGKREGALVRSRIRSMSGDVRSTLASSRRQRSGILHLRQQLGESPPPPHQVNAHGRRGRAHQAGDLVQWKVRLVPKVELGEGVPLFHEFPRTERRAARDVNSLQLVSIATKLL